MIENKGIGSKIFDVINVVILVLITLICILPVWYVLCVSLSSREAVNAGQVALWPVGFNLLSYQKILGESDFFGSFLVSVKRVVLGTGSVWCAYFWQHIRCQEQKNSFRRETSSCGSLYSACCSTEVLFRGMSQ